MLLSLGLLLAGDYVYRGKSALGVVGLRMRGGEGGKGEGWWEMEMGKERG